VFGPLVQKLWRSINFSFKLENAYSPENYPIFGGLYPQMKFFLTFSHASALARGNVVWAVLPSYGKG
jgi:hypothetical protein